VTTIGIEWKIKYKPSKETKVYNISWKASLLLIEQKYFNLLMNQLIQNDRTSGTIYHVLIFRPQGWVKLQIRVLYCVSSYKGILESHYILCNI
jgi:hypothetical protein